MLCGSIVKERLRENGFAFTELKSGDAGTIIVSEYGGRIFGPFLGDTPGLCWIHPCFESRDTFSAFLRAGEWNLGGDRVWLAPETQFNVPNPKEFWNSYTVPRGLDPGNYTLTEDSPRQCRLRQEMTLAVYGASRSEKRLSLERRIYTLANPLKGIPGLKVGFVGYGHEITLKESEDDGIVAEAWNLLQIRPPGTLYIPLSSPDAYTQYYEPFAPGYHTVRNGRAKLKIDARKRYKVGYKAAFTGSKTVYMGKADDIHYAMIRGFNNDPCGGYVKAPAASPELTGHSLHVYNDDGKMGDFAEHECSMLPIGGDTGRHMGIDGVSTLFFFGERLDVAEAARLLT